MRRLSIEGTVIFRVTLWWAYLLRMLKGR